MELNSFNFVKIRKNAIFATADVRYLSKIFQTENLIKP